MGRHSFLAKKWLGRQETAGKEVFLRRTLSRGSQNGIGVFSLTEAGEQLSYKASTGAGRGSDFAVSIQMKGSNPGGFGVSAVLPTTGTLTINLNSIISISRVLRG